MRTHQRKGDTAIFDFSKDTSNIRNISITETGSGAIVGLQLSGTHASEASVESISLRVLVEYRKDQPADVEMIKHYALRQAMRALQHELTLTQARANAKSVRW